MTREKLAILKEEHGLDEWLTWQAIRSVVEGQLEQFSTYNSDKLLGTSEKDILEAMHELNSRIILLDLDRLLPLDEYKSDDTFTILRELRTSHHDIARGIQSSFKKSEEFCNPLFDFEDDVEKIFRKGRAYLRVREARNTVRGSGFRDNGRLITTLFQEIQKQFDEE